MSTTPRQVTSPSPILQELIALGVVRMAADGKTPIVGAPPTTVPLVGYEQDPLTGGIKDLTASGRSMTHDLGLEGAAVLTGLIADYHMTDGSGTTLTDASGNGNHGTLSNPAPTWTPTGLQCSTSALSYVDLPVSLNAAQTIIIAAYNPPPTQANQLANSAALILWGPSVSGGPALYSSINSQSLYNSKTRMGIVTGSSYSTSALDNISGTHILAIVMGSGSPKDQLYVDGSPVTAYGLQDSSLGVMAAGHYQLGAGVTGLGTGNSAATLYGAKFFDRRLSDAEIAQVSQNMTLELVRRGVYVNKPLTRTSSPLNTLIALGDSITLGVGGATPYPSLLSLSGTFTVVNSGVSSEYAADLAATLQWSAIGQVSSGPNSVCVILSGINDLSSSSPANVAAAVLRIADTARNSGLKVVLCTLPSANGQDAHRNSLNVILRANWQQHADALCDVAANANIGTDGTYANATYFQDGLHFTTAGNTIVAGMVSSTVNALFSGPCAFSVLPAPSVGLEGVTHPITDSTTAVFGATITGGGANHVVAYCNGTTWVVR